MEEPAPVRTPGSPAPAAPEPQADPTDGDEHEGRAEQRLEDHLASLPRPGHDPDRHRTLSHLDKLRNRVHDEDVILMIL
jgi:hypothetical protein